MIGKAISHYKIIEKLGEGGMGVVYKAQDTKLKRTVALKFIKPKVLEDEEEKRRLVREAQAAAALDHPNICTIYEINEAEGKTFIAMAYIDGQSLREKIKAGPMKIEEALAIATQVAEGLQEAHEKGIIHRDIKTGNIMVTKKGQAKIMDFGLAMLTGETKITRTGTTIGTLAYMSPEQIHGEELDHRTDIWSFGVVLYEMLTGQVPFQRENQAAMIYSVLNDQPKPLSSIRSEIPQDVEQVINKALRKDKAQRYQSMRELLLDLKKPSPAIIELPKPEKSIVVLPFEDISPGRDNEYFSDGLTEEIITDLSQVQELLVISRSSAMTFKGTKKKIKEIARDVNVQYVLEGSVRKAGNNLRITAQLIDATNDAHLWAEKYSGTLDDVFDIQEKVSRSIVNALKLKLSPEEKRKIAERPIDDVQAYEFHLRALYEMFRGTEEGLERALQLINNGLRIVGDNEILLGDMGAVYFGYFNWAIKKEESYLKKAEEYMEKVFAINPDSIYGHVLKGCIHTRRGNAQEAVREFKRALVLDPNNTLISMSLAWIYAHSGKPLNSRAMINEVLEIDPLTPLNYMTAGTIEMLEGKFDIAIKPLYKAHQIEQTNPIFRYWYAKNLAYKHNYEEASNLFDLIAKDSPGTIWAWLSLFSKYALQKKKSKALQSVTEEFKSLAQKDEILPILMAESFALIDEKEEAFSWLEQGVNWGFIHYPFLSEHDPFLENIRGEERFKKLMERVKYEWEHFEV
jgi:serine/threonine protein kinase/Tfp pilus assembly protein PilF